MFLAGMAVSLQWEVAMFLLPLFASCLAALSSRWLARFIFQSRGDGKVAERLRSQLRSPFFLAGTMFVAAFFGTSAVIDYVLLSSGTLAPLSPVTKYSFSLGSALPWLWIFRIMIQEAARADAKVAGVEA